MRLFAIPDGRVDRRDRAQWLTMPFDLSWGISVSNEIKVGFQSGASLYCLIRNAAGQVYKTTTETFVTYTTADLANYAIAMVDAGGDLYQADFPTAITAAGTYYVFAFVAAGAPAESDAIAGDGEIQWDGSAEVVPVTGDDLITLAYAKDFLNVTVSTYDSRITARIHAASEVVKAYCRRNFVNKAYVEYHDPSEPSFSLILRNYPVTDLTTVTLWPYDSTATEAIDGAEFIVSDYGRISLKPTSTANWCYVPAGFQTVKVEYEAGYLTIPSDVQEATAIIVQRLYRMIGIQGGGVYESETIGDYSYKLKANALQALTDDVKAMLSKYRVYVL